MSKDFYKILGVPRSASEADIKKAYRKQALKWHPDRVPPEKKDEAQTKFQEIGEAFETLSDKEKKRIYDQVSDIPSGFSGEGAGGNNVPFRSSQPAAGGGTRGMSGMGMGGRGMPGMPGGMGGMGGMGPGVSSFQFGPGTSTHTTSHTSADDIFKQFFGTSDPFAAGGDEGDFGGFGGFPSMHGNGGMGSMPGMGHIGGMGNMGGMGPRPGMVGLGQGSRSQSTSSGFGGHPFPSGRSQSMDSGFGAPKPTPVTHDLNVTLEDLYKGTTKRMRITSKKVDPHNPHSSPTSVSSDKEIVVKPGWKDGTKITFEREGDQGPGITPGDVIFTLKTKPHPLFSREGDNLNHVCRVTLSEALSGVSKTVTSLDGRVLNITARSVTPDKVKTLPGEGMPNSKTKVKGDLKVTFLIEFPDFTGDQRARVLDICQEAGYGGRK
ncbi:hypothetical protein B484DRAFT_214172 [Ochromonadaceae sp. CCMP2298]|nr:hypothetical protein B484DRAFT_214172 [Ochromonadaceae sp. CCMP2298]